MSAVVEKPELPVGSDVPVERSTERRACSIDEAARALGMPRSTAYLLAANGEFPAKTIKAGKRYYVVIASLDALLAA